MTPPPAARLASYALEMLLNGLARGQRLVYAAKIRRGRWSDSDAIEITIEIH
jgi:hypothetical protein